MKEKTNTKISDLSKTKIEKRLERRSTNRITVNMGGRERVLVIGMKVSMYISELIPQGQLAQNMYERYAEIIYIGLNRAENELPEDYSRDLVVEWIDDMEQIEFNEVKRFIDEAMGFIIQDYISSMERLGGSLGELDMESEETKQALKELNEKRLK